MNWPRKIDVTIDYGDNEPTETSATLLQTKENYGGQGPMAEYESASGQRFWIDGVYMQECQAKKQLPNIPIEVIRKNEDWYAKKAYGERLLNKQQKQQQTGLILPDGFDNAPVV